MPYSSSGSKFRCFRIAEANFERIVSQHFLRELQNLIFQQHYAFFMTHGGHFFGGQITHLQTRTINCVLFLFFKNLMTDVPDCQDQGLFVVAFKIDRGAGQAQSQRTAIFAANR